MTAPAATKSFLPNVLQTAEPSVFVSSAATPITMQQISDSVPEDLKCLLQKFPSILRTDDVMPTPANGVEHHIHMAPIPQFLRNPVAWIQKNLKLQKRNSNVWNPAALFAVQITMGLSLAHGAQKRWILVVIITVSIW